MKGFLSLSRRIFRLFAVTILACGIAAAATIVANGVSTNVPEPASLAMVGGALVALAILVRRRRLSRQDDATGGAS